MFQGATIGHRIGENTADTSLSAMNMKMSDITLMKRTVLLIFIKALIGGYNDEENNFILADSGCDLR